MAAQLHIHTHIYIHIEITNYLYKSCSYIYMYVYNYFLLKSLFYYYDYYLVSLSAFLSFNARSTTNIHMKLKKSAIYSLWQFAFNLLLLLLLFQLNLLRLLFSWLKSAKRKDGRQ